MKIERAVFVRTRGFGGNLDAQPQSREVPSKRPVRSPPRFYLLTLIACAGKAGHAQAARPRTGVITNDDGIQERDHFMPMVETFSKYADTCVVVPSTKRSGSTNYVTWAFWNKRVLEAELVSKRPATQEYRSLTVYAVDGYPADCVLFVLVALLGGSPPDLLVFGAARVAAALAVPAIAVSDVGARPAVFFHKKFCMIDVVARGPD